ncbi:MAG: MFS transporter [bacterium]|nr:MFS transporter [bacterium]MCY4162767.1 MFS transporter [bacterium]MCY4257070.1 MFS transporter [bacterium]
MPERLVTHKQPLFTSRFVLQCVCGLLYFVSLGLAIPVLPAFVENELSGGPVAVGIVVGGFGVSAALSRPIVGPLGDSLGRRFLVVCGAVCVGCGLLGNLWVSTVAVALLFRFLTGLGEAAFFVGLASVIQDNAPEDRRGEATSYFSVVVYVGLACGPLIGEQIADTVSYNAVWITGGLLCVGATLLGATAVQGRPEKAPLAWPDTFIHRPALRPAVLLGCGLMGFSGFLAFAELYVEDIGFARSGLVFATLAIVVVSLRIVLARLPDRLGPRRTSAMAFVASLIGLWVLTFWQQVPGVFVGAVFLAIGQAFLFPALFVMAVDSAPFNKRSQAIATFTIAFDLAVGIGSFLLGGVVAVSSYSGAFFVGGCFSLAGLLVSRVLIKPDR